jgi:hypothetical protein
VVAADVSERSIILALTYTTSEVPSFFLHQQPLQHTLCCKKIGYTSIEVGGRGVHDIVLTLVDTGREIQSFRIVLSFIINEWGFPRASISKRSKMVDEPQIDKRKRQNRDSQRRFSERFIPTGPRKADNW